MSDQAPAPGADAKRIAAELPAQNLRDTDGLHGNAAIDELTERRVDEIEMIGEEVAGGLRTPKHSEVSAGMRYLHCSRTIHQLVTDRNRAVGLYLAVATLLWTASSALLSAKPAGVQIVPIEVVQRWCLPVSFGIMTVLALLVAFLLIRTRVGLIYEVAKMNVLCGLPIGRVQRINPMGIFFIMHMLVSLAGGGSAALFAIYMLHLTGTGLESATWPAALIGAVVTILLIVFYIVTVLHTTSDQKLGNTK
jgi:hypothetical protein